LNGIKVAKEMFEVDMVGKIRQALQEQ